MRIDGRSACLQPDMRRPGCAGDRLAHHASRRDPRLQDFPTIRRAIPAVDAAPRKVDDHVRAVDLVLPGTQNGTIPADHAPRPTPWLSAEHGDIVAVMVEGSRQHRSNLSGAPWNHDSHGHLLSADEPTSELGTRDRTAIVAAEEAIATARDDVIRTVANSLWQNAHPSRRLPRPAELRGDEQCSVAPGEDT
jgi:hypothetical protein